MNTLKRDYSHHWIGSTMKATGIVLAITAGTAALAFLLNVGFNRSEIVECNQWAEQAHEYAGFYLTQWQKDQCDAHGIDINAPVK